MRIGQFIAGLLCVLVGAAGIAPGQPAGESPDLRIEVQPSHLKVSGVVSSVAHEVILRETAARLFADRNAEFSVEVRGALPPGWALVTDLTLQALAETRSSIAMIDDSGISIRGFSKNADRWTFAASRIEDALPAGWSLHQQMEEISSVSSINRQCIELFRTAMRGRKIEFARASSTLGTATGPLLDELIQIVTDCPGSLVSVTGHTDSTGAENVNLALSQARAEAVARYLVAGGVLQGRITATGVGSAEPLTEESSPQARQLNRRIEVELRFP